MGVVDGQPVSAEITNPAFINKNQADQMPNQLDFTSAQSGFGSSVFNIQKCINAIFSFAGAITSAAYNALPAWVTNNFGTPTDTLFARVSAIDAAFNPASGALAGRAGNVSIPVSAASVTATFTTALTGTNYVVLIGFVNTLDASPIFLQAMVTYRATTGFVATLNAQTDSTNYVLTYWAGYSR